jgi:hypothetical protein
VLTCAAGARTGAFDFDQDPGVVGIGQCVYGGARLAIAVDRHGQHELWEGAQSGAADMDRLDCPAGTDMEVDRIMDPKGTRVLIGDVHVGAGRAVVDGLDRLA